MTFGQLTADCYRRLGYSASPAAPVQTRLRAFLNEAHEELLAEPGVGRGLYGSLTIASVASQARYGLSNVSQVSAFTEATNDQRLAARSLSWYRTYDPDPASTEGTPEAYVPLGIVALQTVPAVTGTGLWAVSSSTSDTAVTVSADARRVGGYPHLIDPVTLTGTTRVALGAVTDYIDAAQVQLSAVAVGDVSIYDAASSGTVLAVIPRGQTLSRYWGVLLCPTPSAAITYTVDVEYERVLLIHDTDEPLVPIRFHRLLAMSARAKEYEFTENARYSLAAQAYAAELKKLKYAQVSQEAVTVPGGGLRDEGSNLGPWYPSGRWS